MSSHQIFPDEVLFIIIRHIIERRCTNNPRRVQNIDLSHQVPLNGPMLDRMIKPFSGREWLLRMAREERFRVSHFRLRQWRQVPFLQRLPAYAAAMLPLAIMRHLVLDIVNMWYYQPGLNYDMNQPDRGIRFGTAQGQFFADLTTSFPALEMLEIDVVSFDVQIPHPYHTSASVTKFTRGFYASFISQVRPLHPSIP